MHVMPQLQIYTYINDIERYKIFNPNYHHLRLIMKILHLNIMRKTKIHLFVRDFTSYVE